MNALLSILIKRDITKPALAAFVLIGACLYGIDILCDRTYKLAIVEPTSLLSISPLEHPDVNPARATLQSGTPVRVLRMRYGKDYQAFQVETSDGKIGWVLGGREVRTLREGFED